MCEKVCMCEEHVRATYVRHVYESMYVCEKGERKCV